MVIRMAPSPRGAPVAAVGRSRAPGSAPPAAAPGLRPIRERRLGRRQARDRDPVGRAADVVHPRLMAEGHGAGLASVLAADADLEPGPGRPTTLHRPEHQLAYSLAVERVEGIVLEDSQAPLVHVLG